MFKRADDDRYTNLCGNCRNPHQLLTRHGPGDMWRCDYCGQTGTEAHLRSTDCTYLYPPCDQCGEHPYCSPDCDVLAAVRNNPDVYITPGFDTRKL